jgi:hypothetical protein
MMEWLLFDCGLFFQSVEVGSHPIDNPFGITRHTHREMSFFRDFLAGAVTFNQASSFHAKTFPTSAF